jgi:endonuclease-3
MMKVRAIMPEFPIHHAIHILRQAVKNLPSPLIDAMAATPTTPYQILIATLLSLRTKDSLTAQVTPRLFALADTPAQMVRLTAEQIEQAIYPVGFYRTKAQTILHVSHRLLDDFGGAVPANLDDLLSLKGVGRKTANLVLTAGFGLPGICVDIHVHRISNRWGYINTKTADQSELALRQKLPPEYWLEYNKLLVTLGQNICTPISPRCSQCPLKQICPKIKVDQHR